MGKAEKVAMSLDVNSIDKPDAIRVFRSLGIEIDPNMTQEDVDKSLASARQQFPYSECDSLKDWELCDLVMKAGAFK